MKLYFHRRQLVILSVCLLAGLRKTYGIEPLSQVSHNLVERWHLGHGGNHYMPEYSTNMHKKSFIIQSLYCTFEFFHICELSFNRDFAPC